MGSESVASCPQPSPASPGSPLLNKAQNVQNNTFERFPNKGACFFCHEAGHWVRDCPSRSNPTPGSGSPTAGRRSYQELQCPCGYGACIVFTSRTVKNPGRDFYRCPGKQSEQCGFFKWCDEIASSQIPKFKSPVKTYRQQHDDINDFANHGLKSPMNHGKQHGAVDHLYPVCSCGAGKCILMTMHDGENAGRKYFACPIKKGQGACNHFQWYDSPMNAKKLQHSDCLLEKPNLLRQDNKDACEAINIAKTEDSVAPVSPILQDQMFWQEQQASNRERELKNQGAYKTEHSDHLLNKTNLPTLYNKQACKAINVSEAKDTVAPVSLLLKQDQRDAFLQISPVKRLSLEDGSPDAGSSKLKRCLKFGGEGHGLNEHEHSASPSSPCFNCGRFAHNSYG